MADAPPGAKAAGGNDGDTSNDAKLVQFMDFTGAAEDVAKYWLEASAYSVENAVNMFMESGGSSGLAGRQAQGAMRRGVRSSSSSSSSSFLAPAAGSEGAPGMSGQGGSDDKSGAEGRASSSGSGADPNDPDYVRPADPYKRQRLVDDTRPHGFRGVSIMRPWGASPATNPFRDFSQESRQASHAFTVKGEGAASNSAAAAKQRKLANIFSPPTEIMFMGDFQAARQAAKISKTWLLVNIQSDVEFDCHKLNRDLWKDEMVQNIIACSCIFWQQPSVSEEAKTFCRRYHVTGFPHIAIIDPRTGMKVWSYQGFLEPTEFVEKVTDVTDKMSLEDGAPVRLPPPPEAPRLPPNTSGSEDQMMAAAIFASLETAKKSSKAAASNGHAGEGSSDSGEEGGSDGGNPELVDVWNGGVRPSSTASPSSTTEASAGASVTSLMAVATGAVGSAVGVAATAQGSGEGTGHQPPPGGTHASRMGGTSESPASVDDEEEEEADSDVAVLGSPGRGTAAGVFKGKGRARDAGGVVPGARGQGMGKGKGKGKEGGLETNGDAAGGSMREGASGEVVDVSGDDEVRAQGTGSNAGLGPAAAAAAATSEGQRAHGAGDVAVHVDDEADAEGAEALEKAEELLEDPPEDSSPDKTSVRFQFPTGQRVVRRFRKGSKVRQLYLFVASTLDGAKTKPFDIRTVRPPSSVRHMEDDTIQEAALSNSAVVVVWQD